MQLIHFLQQNARWLIGGFSLYRCLWPEIYGTKHLGSVRSVVIALIVFASAIDPGLTGVLIDHGISFEIQLHTMAIYCFVTSLLMFFVAKVLIRRRHLLNIGVTRHP